MEILVLTSNWLTLGGCLHAQRFVLMNKCLAVGIHYTSCHPVHIKDSIIYSLFLRYKRICTRNTDVIEHSKGLTTHLLDKAYPIKVIIEQWNKVTKIPRTELLKQKQQASNNCLPVSQTYHPNIFPTKKAVMKEWKRYSKFAGRPTRVQQHNSLRM